MTASPSDLSAGVESRYQTILAMIPENVEIIMNNILPIGASQWSGVKIEPTNVRYGVTSAKAVNPLSSAIELP